MSGSANDAVLGKHLNKLATRVANKLATISGGASVAVFTGATTADGTSGLVPAPQAGDNGKFLRGDGTWATVESGSSGGGYIIGSKVSSVEGGFWQGIINDTPVLKLRHGDYEYNFAYDNLTFTGGASSVLETVTPNTYVLGTASVSNDGGVWYEVNNDVPTLNLHNGSFNYSFNYDTITYKGGNSHLAAYLPFDASPTADACGNTWVVTGNPIITADPTGSGNALYLDGSSYLTLNNLALGEQDFTLDAWFYFITISSDGARVLELHNGNVDRHIPIMKNGYFYNSNVPCPPGQWNHCAMVYTNDDGYLRCYVNGQLADQAQLPALQVRQQFPTMYIGTSTYGDFANGYVKNFRIFDGQARWTSNFTPPTAEDYL